MTPGLVVLLALLATVGLVPAARAASGPRIGITVDRTVLYGSQHFTATATAGVTCAWTLEWNGDSRRAQGRSLRATFTAPRVRKITKIPLHGTCFYNDPAAERARARAVARPSGTTQTLIVTVPPAWRQTIQITVLPPGSAVSPPTGPGTGPGGPGGGLPNTGGPQLWLALLGLGLLVVGAISVRPARRT